MIFVKNCRLKRECSANWLETVNEGIFVGTMFHIFFNRKVIIGGEHRYFV